MSDLLLTAIFSSLLLTLGAGIFMLPHGEVSYEENRKLAPLPSLSAKALCDGSFFEELSDFYSDNLPMRKEFGGLYSAFELALGKRQTNGVIVLEDGRLIQRSERYAKIYGENLSALDDAKSIYRDRISIFTVPNAQDVFASLVPLSDGKLYREDYSPPTESIGSRFCLAIERPDRSARCYYRTDHHWTTFGAYEGYLAICEEFGIEAFRKEDFEVESLSEGFYGSAFRASALPRAAVARDTVELWRYAGDEELQITLEGKKSIALYDLDALAMPDKYLVFLGGNYPFVSVKAQNAERERLLVIKDSFANSIVPFLARHYDIDLADPRYANSAFIKDLLDSDAYDRILVLCSTDTLASERDFCRAFKHK